MEQGWLLSEADFPLAQSSLSFQYLPVQVFNYLKTLLRTGNYPNDSLKLAFYNGKEGIRVGAFVGVLSLRQNFILEILPKNCTTLPEAKQALHLLLLALPNFRFYQGGLATGMAQASGTLHRQFLRYFFEQLQILVRGGLVGSYEPQEAFSEHIRGRLDLRKQLRQTEPTPTRFWQHFDAFSLDSGPNRLIKAALQHLQPLAQHYGLWPQWIVADAAFAEVETADSITEMQLTEWLLDERMAAYKSVLPWAYYFLQGHWPAIWLGQLQQMPLLFRTEKLFENYVAVGFRSVTQQSQWKMLLKPKATFLESSTQVFHLYPDVVMEHPQHGTMVADAKWKLIAADNPMKTISRNDLFQLYTYANRWKANQAMLIYPANSQFQQPIKMLFNEADLPLWLVPLQLTQPIIPQVIGLFEQLYPTNP